MNYKQLGKSDLNVSQITLGCMSLRNDFKENERILSRAVEAGVNLFDTADLYEKGDNEISIGKILKPLRQKVYIATKVGNQWRSNGSGWDWNPGKDYILAAVEGSLKRLQTDCIDLYQLHGGTIEDPIEETIEAFEILKKQGKIRHYGISSIRPNLIAEYVKRSEIVSVMLQYSLLDRRAEETVLPLLEENNIGVLARGSLAQGLLLDKPAKEYLDYSAEEVEKAAKVVDSVSGNRPKTAVALKFVLQNPAISSAVVGIRTTSQLEEVLKSFSAEDLRPEERDLLKTSLAINRYTQHR